VVVVVIVVVVEVKAVIWALILRIGEYRWGCLVKATEEFTVR
jgi:hypothetical protein